MKSTLVDFTGGAPKLNLNASVSGFANTVQRCLVNLATNKDSDALYPERGTRLLKDASAGKLLDENSAQHSANFAAADTFFFEKSFSGLPESLAAISLTTSQYDGASVTFTATMVAVDGSRIGVDTSI